MDFICNVVENFPDSTSEDKFSAIMELVEMVTQLIQNVREIHVRERQKLQKFVTGKYMMQPERQLIAVRCIFTHQVYG